MYKRLFADLTAIIIIFPLTAAVGGVHKRMRQSPPFSPMSPVLRGFAKKKNPILLWKWVGGSRFHSEFCFV